MLYSFWKNKGRGDLLQSPAANAMMARGIEIKLQMSSLHHIEQFFVILGSCDVRSFHVHHPDPKKHTIRY